MTGRSICSFGERTTDCASPSDYDHPPVARQASRIQGINTSLDDLQNVFQFEREGTVQRSVGSQRVLSGLRSTKLSGRQDQAGREHLSPVVINLASELFLTDHTPTILRRIASVMDMSLRIESAPRWRELACTSTSCQDYAMRFGNVIQQPQVTCWFALRNFDDIWTKQVTGLQWKMVVVR